VKPLGSWAWANVFGRAAQAIRSFFQGSHTFLYLIGVVHRWCSARSPWRCWLNRKLRGSTGFPRRLLHAGVWRSCASIASLALCEERA